MDIYVLSQTFEVIHVIDECKSLIWVERYCAYGDFEIYTQLEFETYKYLVMGNYLQIKESSATMIIEHRQIKYEVDEGFMMIIKGRSLESLLTRRIVWGQERLLGDFQDSIEHLLCVSIIEPTDPKRVISNFIFEASTDTYITALTIDTQLLGENLYDTIRDLCANNDLGFKVILTDDFKFKFSLYYGKDHGYDQFVNPYVIFSPEYENLLTADHTSDTQDMKTATLVLGAGDGAERAGVEVTIPNRDSGLDRRETYTDASDVSEEVDGIVLSPEDYAAELDYRGWLDLLNYLPINAFEGQVDPTGNFIFGEHFNLGDVVELENGYGDNGKARVVEYVRTEDPSGLYAYPTFEMIEE
jgi:hypothetical protein